MVQKMEPISMNRSKCKVMRFYQPVLEETSRYHIHGTQIDFTDNYKDLGILVSNTLDWSQGRREGQGFEGQSPPFLCRSNTQEPHLLWSEPGLLV